MAEIEKDFAEEFNADMDIPAASQKKMSAEQEKDNDPFEFASKDSEKRVGEPKTQAEAPKAKDYSAAAFRTEFRRAMNNGEKSFEWKRPDGTMYQVAAVFKKPAAAAKSAVAGPVASEPKPAAQADTPKAEPVVAKPVRGGFYAKGDSISDPKQVKPALTKERIEQAADERRASDTQIRNDFDNTPISKTFKAIGDALTMPSTKTAKSHSPMRGS